MHGPGLFLMILRKGLGLFFERTIPKAQDTPMHRLLRKNSDFPQAWDRSASRSDPESIPKE